MTITPANVAQLTMQLEINGSAEQVWAALINDIGKWWPADFYAGGEDGARDYTIEPWPGGRMFESWQGDGGVLWGTVCGIDAGKALHVLGVSFPQWGGPSQWYGTWTLEPIKKGTKLTFSESTIGQVSESNMTEKDKGWLFLWKSLQAFVEKKPPPKWS